MISDKSSLFTASLTCFLLFCLLSGCMRDDQWVEDHRQQATLNMTTGGLFVVNEGNFMYGNATLSYYDTVRKSVENDLFYRVNGLPLGDVAESMNVNYSRAYVVVNNSGKIYIFDSNTGRYTGKITGLTSPRFMHFVNNTKAYISDLYAGKITIVNPETGLVTGTISCPAHASTEEMVQVGNQLFVTCWSGDKTVLVISTDKDQIIEEIATGDQPCGIVRDKFNKIWVLCQALPGSSVKSNAVLQRIDPTKRQVDLSLKFQPNEKPVKLVVDGQGEQLYFLVGNEIRKMDVSTVKLPEQPFVTLNSRLLYGLGVDPVNGNIYVSDALDYLQPGVVTRFSVTGVKLDSFKAGIIPGRFCFK